MNYEDNMVSIQILPQLPQFDFSVPPTSSGWRDALERAMAAYSRLPLLDGLPTNSELKAWVASQDLKPLPRESWSPYRPEVAAPFYARQSTRTAMTAPQTHDGTSTHTANDRPADGQQ